MASFRVLCRQSRHWILASKGGCIRVSTLQARNAGHNAPKPWNYLWEPGPYPRTEEERVKAAKKYGMLPEDYQPYPEDKMMGDYPMLESRHTSTLPGNTWYDMPVLRRNFGEPVPADFLWLQQDRIDNLTKKPLSDLKAFGYFVLVLVGLLTPLIWTHYKLPVLFPYSPPMKHRDGHTYYFFEPAE